MLMSMTTLPISCSPSPCCAAPFFRAAGTEACHTGGSRASPGHRFGPPTDRGLFCQPYSLYGSQGLWRGLSPNSGKRCECFLLYHVFGGMETYMQHISYWLVSLRPG